MPKAKKPRRRKRRKAQIPQDFTPYVRNHMTETREGPMSAVMTWHAHTALEDSQALETMARDRVERIKTFRPSSDEIEKAGRLLLLANNLRGRAIEQLWRARQQFEAERMVAQPDDNEMGEAKLLAVEKQAEIIEIQSPREAIVVEMASRALVRRAPPPEPAA